MSAEHWDRAYEQGDTTRSWYQRSADVSLELLTDIPPSAAVIDIGGGASTLVDGLQHRSFTDLTVLDVSEAGMQIAQDRLGSGADKVTWIATDLLDWQPDRTYDVWHDRAVLHFLTEPADIDRYRTALSAATGPGSTVVIGAFGPGGPTMCSGLPTRQYDARGIMTTLGPEFELDTAFLADHRTPGGATQQFQWLRAFRRSA